MVQIFPLGAIGEIFQHYNVDWKSTSSERGFARMSFPCR